MVVLARPQIDHMEKVDLGDCEIRYLAAHLLLYERHQSSGSNRLSTKRADDRSALKDPGSL
jgi:hypothetical protein